MSIRLGFPVVLQGSAWAVWVGTGSAAGRRGRCHWNGDGLHLDNPFPRATKLNQAAAAICAAGRDIYFQTNLPLKPTEGGWVELEGDSWELVIELMKRHDIPLTLGSGEGILLTGALNTRRKPIALNQPDSLKRKALFATDRGYALLVVDADYTSLSGVANPESPDSTLPARLADLLDLLRSRGRVLRLPLRADGTWRDGIDWVAGAGSYFELKPIAPLPKANVPPNPTPQAEDKDLSDPALRYKDMLGALYVAALPDENERESLARFEAHNREMLRKAPFTGGAVNSALEKLNELFSDPRRRDILISGPTASGKTFLTEALMLNTLFHVDQKVVYVAPTRALAYERGDDLRDRFTGLLREEEIVVSTGETVHGDSRFSVRGNWRIVVTVNEKLNLFLRPGYQFLRGVGLLILDELHMISDPHRGGVLDLLLAKCRDENTNRGQNRMPLRVVGISTETLATSPAVIRTLSFDAGQEHIPPLQVVATERPIPVAHSLALLHDNDNGFGMVSLVTFSSDRQRKLGKTEAETLKATIAASRKSASRGRAKVDYTQGHRDVIMAAAARPGVGSIMVAAGSIGLLKTLAEQVRAARQGLGLVAPVPTAYMKLLKRGTVGASVGADLLEHARHGIYFHNSDLPHSVRDIVTRHFRKMTTEHGGAAAFCLPPRRLRTA